MCKKVELNDEIESTLNYIIAYNISIVKHINIYLRSEGFSILKVTFTREVGYSRKRKLGDMPQIKMA